MNVVISVLNVQSGTSVFVLGFFPSPPPPHPPICSPHPKLYSNHHSTLQHTCTLRLSHICSPSDNNKHLSSIFYRSTVYPKLQLVLCALGPCHTLLTFQPKHVFVWRVTVGFKESEHVSWTVFPSVATSRMQLRKKKKTA